MPKVRILWLSRHEPIAVQFDFLRKKLGDLEIITEKGPFSTVQQVMQIVNKYKPDYILPVLPLSFTVRLLEEAKKRGYKVLWSEMILLHEDDSPNCPEFDPYTDVMVETKDVRTKRRFWRHFRFKEIKVLKGIKFEFEPL